MDTENDQAVAQEIAQNLAPLVDRPAAPEPAPAPAMAASREELVAKLQAKKASAGGAVEFTLKESGVVVSMPKFKPYDAWERAARLAKGDQGKVQVYFLISLLTFDGQRLTYGDYRELISQPDHVQIMGEVYGRGDEGDDAGK